MPAVAFDWSVWSARYPELVAKGVTEPLATSFFAEAGLLLNNTDCSVVTDDATRLLLLNMITAHIAALWANANAGNGGAVGRMASATQGSVSVSLDYGQVGRSEAWWVQTPYGAQWWASTAMYRTMQYVPGPQPYLGSFMPQYGRLM